MFATNFTDLPNEVIYQILQHLPPSSVPALELVSRSFRNLARQPTLWQQFCCGSFNYWASHQTIHEKLAQNVAEVDWKGIYAQRHEIDRFTTRTINSILASQASRLEKSERIIELGYDTKDTLMRHLQADSNTEDVLARRYYSAAVVGCLHRAMAVEEWARLRDGQHVSLEKALEAFDMFVVDDSEEDLDGISGRLNSIVHRLRIAEPELDNQTPRQKAVKIVTFLRSQNFTGITDETQYHALPHNFLGIALQNEEHQCLPLVNVAIFCCVAQRLGLDAQPCGFPFHVYAIVKAPQGSDLDGRHLDKKLESPSMYMDPWNSSAETPMSDLISRLNAMRADPSDHQALLGVSSTADIVRRTARNIINSVRALSHAAGGFGAPSAFPNLDGAFYGAVWALLMLPEGPEVQVNVQRDRYITSLLEHLERVFYLDVPLFEKYVLPLFRLREYHAQIRCALQDMRIEDSKPIQPKYRPQATVDNVQFKVGQVFRHKRYHYQAIIFGWDVECEAGDLWIAQMGVQTLPRGRHQAFYHVKVADRSVRYVAEENIELIKTENIDPALMAMAGQYFKRWDDVSKEFVSNIKDQYPDD